MDHDKLEDYKELRECKQYRLIILLETTDLQIISVTPYSKSAPKLPPHAQKLIKSVFQHRLFYYLLSHWRCVVVYTEKLKEFIDWSNTYIRGYEKGESQLFLDRLFKAYGHDGVLEAGASCEWQLRENKRTKFMDLFWPGRVLIEMKSRGEDLNKHYSQARDYWNNTYKDRPKYVVLCNFDDFWIYDWNQQRDPVDKVPLSDLTYRWKALQFLSTNDSEPMFGNNRVELTKEAAKKIVSLYNALIKRKEIDEATARRFILQCLVCMFAEDSDMFPDGTILESLIDDCLKGQSSYDLLSALFIQMNSKEMATGGRFVGIPYFNGGIFSIPSKVELNDQELHLLRESSRSDWSKVEPSIFGTIFEQSLGKEERHTMGAHYTTLAEIMAIVEPTILRPWRERIRSADTLRELEKIHEDMGKFKVLDPACGSGNFLYIAYIELRHLELELMEEMERFPSFSRHSFHSVIRCNQFYGIDLNTLGIELAKVTLAMAKKKTSDEFNKATRMDRLINPDEPLPFDNLDNNFINGDALFCDWPDADAIIGNPPYQSKNKMQKEFGPLYLDKLRNAYPEMPGLADYCVYWFRKAHDQLKIGGRAGLVGTNTIRQTNSRVGGLDYITYSNGEILEAISTMPWSGTADVYVSIVNWIKKKNDEEIVQANKILRENVEGKGWKEYKLKTIPSSLSNAFDVKDAISLKTNKNSNACFQGQTHGHESFLLSSGEYTGMIEGDETNKDVLFPFLIADDLIGTKNSQPNGFVIDFGQMDIFQAKKYKIPFEQIEKSVLPARKLAFEEELSRNAELLHNNPKARVNHHHENFFNSWWQLSYSRPELMKHIRTLNRYISCGQVTKRPIFEFVSSDIHPNAALMVFPMEDDFSFGILQSSYHWKWFNARCSTLEDRPRYTSTTVFDSFPWPQWGILEKKMTDLENREKECHSIVLEVAKTSKNLRTLRRNTMKDHSMSLRELYRTIELPGKNPLKDAQASLDKAVRKAYLYGLAAQYSNIDDLELLFKLNNKCAEVEKTGKIYTPGIPCFFKDTSQITSYDCVRYKGEYFN